MITKINNEYSDILHYLEFINYNNFELGHQHIVKLDLEDPHVVPEFINIRNRYNIQGELEPCIDIEVVTS